MTQKTQDSPQYQQIPQQGQHIPPPPYPYYYTQPEENEVNLLDLWKILFKNIKLIMLITVISTSFSVVIAITSTPIYRAETLLSPVNKAGQGGGIANLAGQLGGLAAIAGVNLGGADAVTQTAIAILKSRRFTETFIKDNKILPLLFEFVPQKELDTNAAANFKNIPTMWKVYQLFNGIREISEDNITGLVTLSIEWSDPELAAKWANGLVTFINAKLRADAIEKSEMNLKFLREQIEKTSVVEIQQSMFKLIEGEMKKAMLANVGDEYAFKVIDPAVVPEDRIKPNRRLIVSLGMVIGVMLGVIIAFILNAVRNWRDQEKLMD